MAVTLTQIRAGLATALTAIQDVTGQPTVTGYMLANPTPPAVHLYPGEISWDLAMQRGLDRWSFVVQAFVSVTLDQDAQANLDLYLAPAGNRSIKQALEADPTLGGIVQDTQVVSSGGYRIFAAEGRPPVLGAEWTVEVLATGT